MYKKKTIAYMEFSLNNSSNRSNEYILGNK